MRRKTKSIKITLLAALVFGAVFVYQTAAATVTLPTTACDTQWNAVTHLNQTFTTVTMEDGTKAFKYGSNNSSFVSEASNIVTFTPDVLFTPTNGVSVFKVYAISAACSVFYADTSTYINAGLNTITYNRSTNEMQFNTEGPGTVTGGVPRYLGFDVWDGANGSSFASYSYLVDLNTIQNPTQVGSPAGGGSSLPSEPTGKRPVLIVPGIMGSELYENGKKVWIDKIEILSIKDSFLLEALALDGKGNSAESVEAREVIKKILTIDTFGSLTDLLLENGYSLNTTIEFFPYDWRLDLKMNIGLLKAKIDSLKRQTGFHKIDIVAHSMGGLLVKDYIEQSGKDSINKLIFVGTPHLGAPKAAKALLEGDTDIPFNVLNKNTMKQLSLNMPSIYQLLPSRKYFEIFTGYINLSTEAWQKPYIIDYDQTRKFLEDKKLNLNLLAKSDLSLDNLNFEGIKTYNIIGCGVNTYAGFRFTSALNPMAGISYTSGDKTVPFMSARYINIPSDRKYYVKKAQHAELPSNIYVRSLILDILNGNKSSLDENNISNGTYICDYKGKQLTWKSPVEVHIYDQFGNHAGPINGGFENNIRGVDYEIVDGEKFIFIPTDEGNTYTIQAKGEKSGSFDLVVSDISNGDILSSYVFNDVGIMGLSKIDVNLSEQPSLRFDYAGDGKTTVLQPDSILKGNEADDLVPPQTSIEITGSLVEGVYNDKISIKLDARDSDSGIMYTKYSINDRPFETYSGPIEIDEVGNVVFKYYSVDNGGNNEIENVRKFTIQYDLGKVLGTNTGLKDGTLVLDETDYRTVYMIGSGGKKYGFISQEVFLGLGYNFLNLVTANLSDYKLGGYVYTVNAQHPDGSLIVDENGTVWLLNYGTRFGFPSVESLTKQGINIKNIIKANWYDLILPSEVLNEF